MSVEVAPAGPPPNPLRAYAAVTAAYWAFMLSDGALRMLVLLHFNSLGFSPIQLAYLFLLYEIAGIVTNLAAGWLAARFGLAATLYGGLALQIAALAALAQLDPGWGVAASVAFVMAVQGVSGVAKDLAKMSSKSAVKLLAPAQDGALFRWVAALTGSKNAVKGLGFFLGAALLAVAGWWLVDTLTTDGDVRQPVVQEREVIPPEEEPEVLAGAQGDLPEAQDNPAPELAPGTPLGEPEPVGEPPEVVSPSEPVIDQLAMSFSQECWVEVSDAAGERLFQGQRNAGQSLSLRGEAPFRVTLGNAAAVTRMQFNGENIPLPQGNPGRVVRVTVP